MITVRKVEVKDSEIQRDSLEIVGHYLNALYCTIIGMSKQERIDLYVRRSYSGALEVQHRNITLHCSPGWNFFVGNATEYPKDDNVRINYEWAIDGEPVDANSIVAQDDYKLTYIIEDDAQTWVKCVKKALKTAEAMQETGCN